jgi:hypothetical protein
MKIDAVMTDTNWEEIAKSLQKKLDKKNEEIKYLEYILKEEMYYSALRRYYENYQKVEDELCNH